MIAQMDDENAALIFRLLREDGEEAILSVTGKGKRPVGTETDAQVAFNLYLEEIEKAQRFASDRRMTRSIQQAIRMDGHSISLSQVEEQIAEHDHGMSVAISNGNTTSPSPEAIFTGQVGTADDDELIEKLLYIYVDGINDFESDDNSEDSDDIDESYDATDQPESSTWAASRNMKKTRQKRLCVACGDRKHFAQLARAPCGDEYCRECFSRLFRDAMVDESLFPPRCCRQPIPLERNRLFLSTDLVQQFRKKAVEFSTPNRTYCHHPKCAVFIPSKDSTSSTASCDECGRRTCTTCKSASHVGDCPNDEPLQEVIQLAREHSWQRCQNCWGMVELDTGCNHMT